MIDVVVIENRCGIWCVGIGHVSNGVIVRDLQTFRSASSATKAAQALAKRSGLLIVRQRGSGDRRSGDVDPP